MCIRDSLIIRAATALGMVALQLFLVGHMALEQHTLSVSGCLLYTSDAADERSSVDLGGRRIIKKKNSATSAVTDDT